MIYDFSYGRARRKKVVCAIIFHWKLFRLPFSHSSVESFVKSVENWSLFLAFLIWAIFLAGQKWLKCKWRTICNEREFITFRAFSLSFWLWVLAARVEQLLVFLSGWKTIRNERCFDASENFFLVAFIFVNYFFHLGFSHNSQTKSKSKWEACCFEFFPLHNSLENVSFNAGWLICIQTTNEQCSSFTQHETLKSFFP